jgi:putative hydrolases of HD superfamily
VTRDRVVQRMAPIEAGAPDLWLYAQTVIDNCVDAGYLKS